MRACNGSAGKLILALRRVLLRQGQPAGSRGVSMHHTCCGGRLMLLRRVARMLMDINSRLMPVRCGLLLVPAAAVERLKSGGNGSHRRTWPMLERR